MAYIFEAQNLTKYFGANCIFEDLSFCLESGEKASLIGANGIGKTTLMNCLMGKESLDEGSIRLETGISIGYLEQIPAFSEDTTLIGIVMEVFSDIFAQRKRLAELEAIMSHASEESLEKALRQYGALRDAYERAGGFVCEAQTRKVLAGLGFKEADFERPFSGFSGGEKTRISLARILVRDHSILFLDEPTNHLDLDSIEWLENYIKAYRGAVLVISHDRYFLDQVTQTTFSFENRHIKRYKGNYSAFMVQKAQEDEALAHAYDKQQREIEKTEEYILKNKAGIKSKQARGRQTRLNRLERIEKPQEQLRFNMGNSNIHSRTGEKVLYLDKISFSFPDRPLFSNLEEEIRYTERVALLGPNGMGKTTLLKIILGQIQPQQGNVRFGARVKPAYFDQEHSNLNPEKTVMDEILDNYDLTIEEAKSLLARFLFRDDDLAKTIGSLSGGEQGRLSLLKLTLEKGNFLILDEPTNHLDINSRGAIEKYLQNYPGTLLMVSHDRFFVDAVADRILELDKGQLTSYIGNYSDYKQKKAELAKLKANQAEIQIQKKGSEVQTDKENRKNRSNERIVKAKLRDQVQTLEKEIQGLEQRLDEVTQELANPETYQNVDFELQQKLSKELEDIQIRLPQAYDEWTETISQLETL
ncbi:MAG TPA: ABC transporter [Peptococcaceae bacterium]|nr:ABC transporter [Peptococcaceae bacterium]